MRKCALIGLVVLCGVSALVVADSAASPGHLIASDRHAATVEARELLAGVALPAGSTALPGEPAGDADQLAAPFAGALFAAEVDLHAFWTTSASPDAAIALFQSHLPSGAKLVSSSSGGGSAGAVYALGTSRPFRIGPEQLILNAITLNDGLTGLRADAQVRYLSPRPPSQRVPMSARLVQITKVASGGKPLLSLVVTSQPVVRKLARLVDALPFVGNATGSFSCPSSGGPIDSFSFRASRSGPVLARVSELAFTPTFPYPCWLTSLTIRGHRLTPLLNGGILLRQASKLLGIRLTG